MPVEERHDEEKKNMSVQKERSDEEYTTSTVDISGNWILCFIGQIK